MNDKRELTDDQWARIEATLKRIRGGLKKIKIEPEQEPAHMFASEVHHAP